MSFEHPGAGALDYFPCRYGRSKLLFRGPKRQLDQDYCAVIGGTETYGRFIEQPYPVMLEQQLGMSVVNLGCVNAGIDVFANDAAILDICSGARVTVMQLVGAPNMSNRFYAVHPRRNDRFLCASPLLKSLFPQVDFADIHFTRHLLTTLRAASADSYAVVEEELKAAWVARMRQLLQRIGTRVLVLWLRDAGPGVAARDEFGPDPMLVDGGMVRSVCPSASDLITVTPTHAALRAGTAGMRFGDLDAAVAAGIAGPRVHTEIAAALLPALQARLSV